MKKKIVTQIEKMYRAWFGAELVSVSVEDYIPHQMFDSFGYVWVNVELKETTCRERVMVPASFDAPESVKDGPADGTV